MGPRRPCVSACGNVRLCTHLLLACHDGEKTSSRRHINWMMFVWLPVSSGWRYGYDTGGKLWQIWWSWEIVCWSYEDMMVHSEWENCFNHHAHQVWGSQKLLTIFDLQGMRMILSEYEDCGVKSLGGDHFLTRHDTDFQCPVSGWHYVYDTVLMYRCIQGESLYIPEKFGRDRKLYVEVRRTWCFTAKDFNWPHHHSQQVWRRRKLFIIFHLQGQTMILTDCEVCGVESVGGGREIMRYGIISKWRPN